jgi:hypothetical protein
MFCRVALHEKTPGSVSSDEAKGLRRWIKGLEGFVERGIWLPYSNGVRQCPCG